MICTLLAFVLLPFARAQDEKKPAPPPPAQEKQDPQDKKDPAPQDKKEPQPEKKPEDEKPAPQEAAPEEESSVDLTAGLRVGGWWFGKFESFIPAGRRRIDSTLLFNAGVDVQGELKGWTLGLSGDYGTGKHLKMVTGAVLFGYEWNLGDEDMPFDVHVAAGPNFGRLDVDVSNFGEFKSAVGFVARVDATAWLNKRIGLGLWLDFRELNFKFDETVLSGDSKAGGPMFAVGASFTLGF
ncbi:MAG TPA: hypothetical protein VNM14_12435 [Planctomycetota bacterium]|nr:hypothetical protein [Planctomycetota bacterium]